MQDKKTDRQWNCSSFQHQCWKLDTHHWLFVRSYTIRYIIRVSNIGSIFRIKTCTSLLLEKSTTCTVSSKDNKRNFCHHGCLIRMQQVQNQAQNHEINNVTLFSNSY